MLVELLQNHFTLREKFQQILGETHRYIYLRYSETMLCKWNVALGHTECVESFPFRQPKETEVPFNETTQLDEKKWSKFL